MAQVLYYLSIITLLLSCSAKLQVKQQVADDVNLKSLRTSIEDSIRFDFTAVQNKLQGTIEVAASLYNDNADTIYFLTLSCEGEPYSLQYDSSKLKLQPRLFCNITMPMIQKLPPNGKHSFMAYFQNNSTDTKIKLGFDFYRVDPTFDVKRVKGYPVVNRPANEQNVIWAKEQTIN